MLKAQTAGAAIDADRVSTGGAVREPSEHGEDVRPAHGEHARGKTSRRAFIGAAGKGLAAAAVLPGFPGHRAVLGARRRRAEQPHQHRRDRQRAASRGATICRDSGSTSAARIMAVCDLDSKRVAGRQDAGQRPLHEEDRQAVRRRHRVRRLSRAARQQGRRRRRHQHAGSLARAHRHSRGRSGQGRLPAEAGLADHRRGARDEQRRPPLGTHLPDRQPAAIVAAVPLRRGAGAQRPHRPAEDGRSRPARRSRRATSNRRCRSRRTSTTTCGSARRRVVPYTENRVHPQTRLRTVRAGCAASSSAPA